MAAAPSPSTSRKLPELTGRIGRFWLFMSPVSADVSGGYTSNWMLRELEGQVVEAEIGATPTLRYKRGRFMVSTPLSASWRETFGFSLRQVKLDGGLKISGRVLQDFQLGAEGGFARTWRPGWPDLYQPLLDQAGARTGLASTDRYSYDSWDVAAGLTWFHPLGRTTVEGGFSRHLYDVDPGYDPVLSPTHLVPLDRDIARASISTQLKFERTLGIRVKGTVQSIADPLAYARDAGTGTTHSGVGGLPSNPRQDFFRWSTDARLSAWLRPLKTRLGLSVGFEHNDDLFQDYYTWSAPSAGADVRVRPVRSLALEASYEVLLRTYTASGYQEGPGHPPLDRGDAVRELSRHRVAAEAAYSMSSRRLQPYVEFAWQQVDTNFPDYEPYLFPEGSAYDIDFDYSWLTVMAGVRLRL